MIKNITNPKYGKKRNRYLRKIKGAHLKNKGFF